MGLGESLYRAVDEGNIEQVRAVLDQKGVDINWKNQVVTCCIVTQFI